MYQRHTYQYQKPQSQIFVYVPQDLVANVARDRCFFRTKGTRNECLGKRCTKVALQKSLLISIFPMNKDSDSMMFEKTYVRLNDPHVVWLN